MRDPYWDSPVDREIRDLVLARQYREAHEKAHEAYKEKIFYLCISKLAGWVPNVVEDAKDLTQDIFHAFLRALINRNYQPFRGSVHRYIFRIANNRLTAKLNAVSWQHQYEEPLGEQHQEAVDPSAASINPEVLAKVQEWWDNLVAIDKQILLLYHQRWPPADIAHYLGMKEENVRKRYSRAMGKFKGALP